MFKYLCLFAFMCVMLNGCTPFPIKAGLSLQEWESKTTQEKEEIKNSYNHVTQLNKLKALTRYQGPSINVTMEGIAFDPRANIEFKFKKLKFFIFPSECKEFTVFGDGDFNTAAVSVCYDGLKLLIDKSTYLEKYMRGSTYIYYDPGWDAGMSYDSISSCGMARLQNLNLEIKSVE